MDRMRIADRRPDPDLRFAGMRGVKPPDFSSLPYKEAVRRASDYWKSALAAACKPK